jgi:hypothetical protein
MNPGVFRYGLGEQVVPARGVRSYCWCLILVACLACVFLPRTVTALADIEGHVHQDSINLMLDMGILEGMPDGNFYPDTELNRAQAAKVAAMLLGYTDANAEEATESNLFTDVHAAMPAEAWARGWINLMASDGIILGDGEGNYDPEGSLTMRQWATIIIRVLGYRTDGLAWPDGYDAFVRRNRLDQGLQYFGDQNITRAQMARLSHTAVDRLSEQGISYLGGTYEGDTLDGVPHGKGSWVHPDGREYIGQWENGMMHGQGQLTLPDGAEYSGSFYEGIRDGHGTYVWASGDQYVGDFQDDEMHGHGTLTWVSGDEYIGDFEYESRTGHGVYLWVSGDRYEGEFQDGVLHGFGTLTWESGDEYSGEFVKGLAHGYGTYTWADGEQVKGEWVEGDFVDAETVLDEEAPWTSLSPEGGSGYSSLVPIPSLGDLYLFAQDNDTTYLGLLTTNRYMSDSVFNRYGSYGSRYSATSIWNSYGCFGGAYSIYSAFNRYTTTPPMIIHVLHDSVSLVGHVTKNNYVLNAVDPEDLYEVLKSVGR